MWGAYFNATSTDPAFGNLNARAVDAILAYMPSQPVWALHGAAYGMGDFSNNAKWMVTGGSEREGGHYRAGLNALPLLERYRGDPDDIYLLHIGIGGITNMLPNVDADGAPSMAFHTHPFVMEHDPNRWESMPVCRGAQAMTWPACLRPFGNCETLPRRIVPAFSSQHLKLPNLLRCSLCMTSRLICMICSGDWGLAFFGHTLVTGSYLVNHTVLGFTCFLCDASTPSASPATAVTVTPRDSFHTRVYIEPLGLHLLALTGVISNVTVDWASQSVTVVFEAPGQPSQEWNGELEAAAPRASEMVLARPLDLAASPFSNFRLLVEAAAPATRPFTFDVTSPAGAQVVRGAWQWSAGSPTQPGVAVITWTAQ